MNENSLVHEIRISVEIQKVCMSIRFPCSLSFQLRAGSVSHESKRCYELKKGECNVGEILMGSGEFQFDEEQYRSKPVLLAEHSSSNGRIHAGSVGMPSLSKQVLGKPISVKKSLEKCPDKSAVLHCEVTWEYLKEVVSLKQKVELESQWGIRTRVSRSDFLSNASLRGESSQKAGSIQKGETSQSEISNGKQSKWQEKMQIIRKNSNQSSRPPLPSRGGKGSHDLLIDSRKVGFKDEMEDMSQISKGEESSKMRASYLNKLVSSRQKAPSRGERNVQMPPMIHSPKFATKSKYEDLGKDSSMESFPCVPDFENLRQNDFDQPYQMQFDSGRQSRKSLNRESLENIVAESSISRISSQKNNRSISQDILLEHLEEDAKSQKDRINKLERERTANIKEMAKLRAELTRKSQHAQLNLKELEDKSGLLAEENHGLKEKLESDSKKSEQQLQEAEQALKKVREENLILSNQVTSHQSKISELETQVTLLCDQLADLTLRSESAKKLLDFKECSYKEQIKKLTEKYTTSESERHQAILELNKLIAEKDMTAPQLSPCPLKFQEKEKAWLEEKNNHLQTIQSLTDQLAQIKSSFTPKKSKYSQCTLQVSDSPPIPNRIEELQISLDLLSKELMIQKQEKLSIQKEKAKLKEQLSISNAENQALKVKLDGSLEERRHLFDDCCQIKKLQSVLEVEKQRLEAEKSELTAEITQYKTKIGSLTKSVGELTLTRNQAEEEKLKIQRLYDTSKKEGTFKIKELETLIQNKQDLYQQVSSELSKYKSQNQKLRLTTDELTRKYTMSESLRLQFEEDLKQLTEEVKLLKEENHKLIKENAIAEEKLATTLAEIKQSQQKSAEMEGKVESLTYSTVQQQREIEQFRSKSGFTTRQMEALVFRVENYQKERNKYLGQIAEKEAQISAEKQKMSELEARNTVLKNENERFRSYVVEREQSCEKITIELAEAQVALSNSRTSVAKLNRAIEILESSKMQLVRELEGKNKQLCQVYQRMEQISKEYEKAQGELEDIKLIFRKSELRHQQVLEEMAHFARAEGLLKDKDSKIDLLETWNVVMRNYLCHHELLRQHGREIEEAYLSLTEERDKVTHLECLLQEKINHEKDLRATLEREQKLISSNAMKQGLLEEELILKETELQNSKIQCRKFSACVEELKEKLSLLEENYTILEGQLESQKAILKDAQNSYSVAKIELASALLKQQLVEQKTEALEKERNRLTLELTQKAQKQSQSIAFPLSLQHTINNLSAQLETQSKTNLSLQKELVSLQVEFSHIHEAHEHLKSSTNHIILSQTREIQDLNHRIGPLQQSVTALEESLLKLQRELDQAKTQINSLSENLTASELRNLELSRQKSRIESQFGDIELKNKILTEQVASNGKQIEALTLSLLTLNEDLMNAQESKNHCEVRLEAANNARNELGEKVDKLECEIEKLEDELRGAKQEAYAARQMISTSSRSISSAKDGINGSKELLANQDLGYRQNKITILEKKLAQWQKKCSELHYELEFQREQFMREIESLTEDNSVLQGENEELQKEVDEGKMKHGSEVGKYKEEIRQLRLELRLQKNKGKEKIRKLGQISFDPAEMEGNGGDTDQGLEGSVKLDLSDRWGQGNQKVDTNMVNRLNMLKDKYLGQLYKDRLQVENNTLYRPSVRQN